MGVRGLHPDNPENALYIFQGQPGLKSLKEIGPTPAERRAGWYFHSKLLDMFWVFRPDGKSYLDEKLKAEHVDTVVIAGMWTDECVLATSCAAFSRGYDVVVVGDAITTATPYH